MTMAASQSPAALLSPPWPLQSFMVFRYTDCTRLPPAMVGSITQGCAQPSTMRDQMLISCGCGLAVELITSQEAVELLV